MELSKIQFGNVTQFEVTRTSDRPFPATFLPGKELELRTVSGGGICLVRPNDTDPDMTLDIATIQCQSQERNFRDLLDRNWQRLAWLVQQFDDRLLIQVHEFLRDFYWAGELEVGFDPAVIQKGQKSPAAKKMTVDEISNWMEEGLILPPILEDDPQRFFLSLDAVASQSDYLRAFRLHGFGLTVDVTRTQDDRLEISKVYPENRRSDQLIFVRGRI